MAPAGTAAACRARLKVSVLAGTSASLAVAVNESVAAFVDRLVADRVQHRGRVHFIDRDGDRLGVGLAVPSLTTTSKV